MTAKSIDRKKWDLLVVLTAPPHTTDALTSVLRLAQAVLEQGKTVRIWACGYNTALTQEGLADTKPINLLDRDKVSPSARGVVRDMLTEHKGRMGWIVCTACSSERGSSKHVGEVRLRSDARLAATVAAADRTVYVGGA